jgi:hypothetical protein
MTARQSVTISREAAGRSSSASQPRPGPGPVAGGPVIAAVGGDRVDPVALLGAEPDQAGPVPQQRAQLTHLRRGELRLGQQVRAEQLRQDRGAGLVVLQPRRSDRLAPQRVHQVRVEAVVLQQPDQPAPAERGLKRHRRPRRQIADQPQHRLRSAAHVLVQLHFAVLGDYRHLGPLAVHVDTDVNRHCRVSFPELGISHPERPATGLSWEGARPL